MSRPEWKKKKSDVLLCYINVCVQFRGISALKIRMEIVLKIEVESCGIISKVEMTRRRKVGVNFKSYKYPQVFEKNELWRRVVTEDPTSIPETLSGIWEYTLDGMCNHLMTQSFTPKGIASLPNDMFLGGGRKPENLEETHADTDTDLTLNSGSIPEPFIRKASTLYINHN